MAGVVIADSGPLIALAGVGQLGLLQKLFGEVLVPEAVRDECLAKPGNDMERIEAAMAAGWLVVSAGISFSKSLSPSLGTGENDAILLAMEDAGNRLLIVDDRLARRYALRQGLPIVGTVRLLYVAEARGLISSAEQCVAAMAEAGYRVSVDLLEKVRRGAGAGG
ncbi:DUF3368 domain-containing protein [Thiolapillus sp.]